MQISGSIENFNGCQQRWEGQLVQNLKQQIEQRFFFRSMYDWVTSNFKKM